MLLRPCGATVGRSFSDLSLGGRWGFSPQALAKEPSALWTLIRGDHHCAKGPARGGRAALAGVTPRNGRGATRNMRGSPYPSRLSPRHLPRWGRGLGWSRSGGAPLRSPRFAHACALRHRGKRRRPPAEAGGGYACSSGHAALRKTAPSRTCHLRDAGAPRPRPSPEGLRPSGLPFGGLEQGRRHGAQQARRACGGHGAQRVRRDAVVRGPRGALPPGPPFPGLPGPNPG